MLELNYEVISTKRPFDKCKFANGPKYGQRLGRNFDDYTFFPDESELSVGRGRYTIKENGLCVIPELKIDEQNVVWLYDPCTVYPTTQPRHFLAYGSLPKLYTYNEVKNLETQLRLEATEVLGKTTYVWMPSSYNLINGTNSDTTYVDKKVSFGRWREGQAFSDGFYRNHIIPKELKGIHTNVPYWVSDETGNPDTAYCVTEDMELIEVDKNTKMGFRPYISMTAENRNFDMGNNDPVRYYFYEDYYDNLSIEEQFLTAVPRLFLDSGSSFYDLVHNDETFFNDLITIHEEDLKYIKPKELPEFYYTVNKEKAHLLRFHTSNDSSYNYYYYREYNRDVTASAMSNFVSLINLIDDEYSKARFGAGWYSSTTTNIQHPNVKYNDKVWHNMYRGSIVGLNIKFGHIFKHGINVCCESRDHSHYLYDVSQRFMYNDKKELIVEAPSSLGSCVFMPNQIRFRILQSDSKLNDWHIILPGEDSPRVYHSAGKTGTDYITYNVDQSYIDKWKTMEPGVYDIKLIVRDQYPDRNSSYNNIVEKTIKIHKPDNDIYLGEKSQPFVLTFSMSDYNIKDIADYNLTLNGKVIQEFTNIYPDNILQFIFSSEVWSSVPRGETSRIDLNLVKDGENNRVFSWIFIRITDRIHFKSTIFSTKTMARSIIAYPYSGIEYEKIKIRATNNANDISPVWQDIEADKEVYFENQICNSDPAIQIEVKVEREPGKTMRLDTFGFMWS